MFTALLPCWTAALHAQDRSAIEAVLLHPIMNDTFVCAEHAEGELGKLGDALGRDCMVIRMDTTRASGRRIPGLFLGEGLTNADWFGWETLLLAPCDGIVSVLEQDGPTNRPGEFRHPGEAPRPASQVEFACDDGVQVVYAHIRNSRVVAGDSVGAGDIVAGIGNNGVSAAPHVHVGAWRGETPLQIRFDLRALGRLRRSR